MAGAARRPRSARRTASLAVLAVVLTASLRPAMTAVRGPGANAPATLGPRIGSPGVAGVSVAWDGTNTSGAGSVRTAISVSAGHTARVVFRYGGLSAASVGNATLELIYLGAVLTLSRAQPSSAGLGNYTARLNWSFGSISPILEGVYQLRDALVYQNGSTAWQSSFFIFVKAPYLLESGAAAVLVVLVIIELFWGLSTIREARRAARKPPVAPWSPSAATPPAEGAAEEPSQTSDPPAPGGET